MAFCSCTKDNYIDSGLSDLTNDCTIWEYMLSDPENWDSTVMVIRHAGLVDVFDGSNSEYAEGITFFGFTNLSIWKFLKDSGYESIEDIPVELCRKMILGYIVKGKKIQQSFDYEIKGEVKEGEPLIKGGTDIQALSGITLRIYRIQNPYGELPTGGAEKLGIYALANEEIALVASCNIQMTNGIVHSLKYSHTWTEL